jgi:hypothetical protein
MGYSTARCSAVQCRLGARSQRRGSDVVRGTRGRSGEEAAKSARQVDAATERTCPQKRKKKMRGLTVLVLGACMVRSYAYVCIGR